MSMRFVIICNIMQNLQESKKNQEYCSESTLSIHSGKLWSLGNMKRAGKLLLETKMHNEDQDQDNQIKLVKIYENGLAQVLKVQDEQCSVRHFNFEFQIIVEVNMQELTVQFSKEDEKIKYKLPGLAYTIAWKNILKSKLNQKGFHQNFKPLKKLGKGTFATVFSALNLQDNNTYAVKAFHKETAYSQQFGKQTIKKQLEVMRLVSHQNIMRLYQVYESDNSLYMIFDYLKGNSLQDRFSEEHVFTGDQIKNITTCLLLGLRELHSLNIMHRDLKPDNLMFRIEEFDQNENKNPNWSKEMVICDLGLAEFCDAQKYLYSRCGTPGYVAPQVINIKDFSTKYTCACDMYSLGLIFHIMLTGRSLFPGSNYEEVLKQNRNYEYEIRKKGIYQNLSDQAIDLLAKMLIKNPETRITAEDALLHPYILGQKLPKTGFSFARLFSFFTKKEPNRANNSRRKIEGQNSESRVKNVLKLQKSRKIVFHEDQEGQKSDEQVPCNPQIKQIFKEQDHIIQEAKVQGKKINQRTRNFINQALLNNILDEINPFCHYLGHYF